MLLVCPKDFSNLPTASAVDVRKQLCGDPPAAGPADPGRGHRAALPEDQLRPGELPARGADGGGRSVPAAYAPECLAACELAFHCRDRARDGGRGGALAWAALAVRRASWAGSRRVEDGRWRRPAAEAPADPDDPAAAVAALRAGRPAAARPEALARRSRAEEGGMSLIATLARLEAVEHGPAQPLATVRHRHLSDAAAGLRAAHHGR